MVLTVHLVLLLLQAEVVEQLGLKILLRETQEPMVDLVEVLQIRMARHREPQPVQPIRDMLEDQVLVAITKPLVEVVELEQLEEMQVKEQLNLQELVVLE